MITHWLRRIAPIALLTIAGCAEPFHANVSRFQALPVPQGQSFVIQAADRQLDGSLEFASYANLVSQRLAGFGYSRAVNPASASLIVSVAYDIDHGREKVRSTPVSPFGFGGYGGYGYGGFGRPYPYYGYGGRAYMLGFYDPFLFDDYNSVESYTVYASQLTMNIARRDNGTRVFEGTAKALSTDDDLTRLVPNLVEAMFTGFPGNSGETVKITVAPPGKRR